MAVEDERSAIGISVTLSSQLISASLAMLAIEGGYVAYVLGNREPTGIFTPLAVLAGLSFITSVFLAGKAVTSSRNSGHSGNWHLTAGKQLYNWQAITCLIGLLLFGALLFNSGKSIKDRLTSKVENVEFTVTELQRDGESRDKAITSIEKRIHDLSLRIGIFEAENRKLRSELDRFRSANVIKPYSNQGLE